MRKKYLNKFGISVVYESTIAFKNFTEEQTSTEMLVMYLLLNNENISKNNADTKKALIELYDEPGNETSTRIVDYLKSEHSDVLFDVYFYEQHFGRMAYIRAIDNFITYLKDILAEIVLKKPQILKSKETETLDFILSYDSIEELILAISEKKVEELFYKGINDIQKFFDTRLGVQIFKDDIKKNNINLLIKQRNLAVHDRGKISKELVKDFPEYDFTEGEILTFKYGYISEVNAFLNDFAIDLDIELCEKFDLETITV